ncbi:uncharacterized protein LOC144428349 isoform X3 [Styela clava]
MMLVFRSFVLALFIFESTSGAAQGIFQCKMKTGCNFPQCDPIPGALNKFGFNIDDYLQVQEFPIVCEARGQQKSVNVLPEIVNDNKEIGVLKQELRRVEKTVKEQNEQLVILKYENRQTKEQHEGALRLVNGRNNKEGRVEIFHAGKWGTICDVKFEIDDANAVCYTLGFSGAKFVLGRAHFGSGSGPIWIAFDHTCSKTNTDFYLCHGPFGENEDDNEDYCGHENDVAVACN